LPGLGGAFGPTLPVEHDFQSHHHIIFARTSNRTNVAYTLTAADIENIDALGVAEVDVGEFVFEVVAVTSEPMDVNAGLSEQEIADLENNSECTEGCSAESESDREFRKLFEIPLENEAGQPLTNRFIGMVFNKQGTEYRLDNGTNKSKLALDQSGLGDLDNPSYRDGTSRKMQLQLKTFDQEGAEEDGGLEEGDVIYLTYVAVKEHYIRQRVVINWTVIDPGTAEGPGAECISFAVPGGYNVSHFRFYEWDMEAEPGLLPTRISGWRAVESFRADVNFVAPVTVNNVVQLADFPIGAPDFTRDFTIIPGKISPSQLDAFIADRSTEIPITVTLDGIAPRGGEFHTNAGIDGNNTAFRTSEWFTRNQFSKYLSYDDAHNHVFFNVHPKALRKRDVDKWGIERYLAVELEKDVNAGKLTFFPFMDDPDVNNPTLGANVALDASNTLFQPVKPVSAYGGNFEAVCGSVGSFPTNPSDGINSYHSFESNRITEKFEIDTRVLVERNFAVGSGPLGPTLLTIEGAGGTRGSVTCISDPSKEFQFAGHTNTDGFLIYNSFSSGHTSEALRSLAFRPDTASPPFKENTDPSASQFEPLVGFSGMIGDIPGVQPGRAVAIASFAQPDSFAFKTTEPDELPGFVQEEQVEEINLPDPLTSPLAIPMSNTYYGSLNIEYELSDTAEDQNESAILLAKVGDTIEGIIDGIVIRKSFQRNGIAALQIDFRWLRASTFELRGDRVEHMTVKSITARSINTDQLNDFLNEQTSHDIAFAQQSLDDRLTDRSLFFSTDVVTMSEDEHSNMYVFFNDADGGISAVATNDFGGSWHYYYGIVEKLGDLEAKDPFAVTHFTGNNCFLFHRLGSKVMCKKIPYSLFEFRDSNLIERFAADVFVSGDEEELPQENQSIYSDKGKILRRSLISYVVAGDLTDESFLELLGKVPGEFVYEPTETRLVTGEETIVRKNPVARAPATAFNNIDINNIFYSAYRKDNGELKFWYLSLTEDSDNVSQLQCHFSVDDGQTWFDLWEFVQNSYNRLRYDTEKKTQFIDRGADGTQTPTVLQGTDPQEGNQAAEFGVNIHWSRLARHKIDQGGEATLDSESQVLEVSSSYVFYQPTTDRVFLFYVYQGCLLCKMFNDSLFSDAAANRASTENGGMARVKEVLERQTRAHFIDGSLSSASLREEIHGFANEDTQEIMAEGNIVFRYPFAADNFTDDRTISDQRVCATDLPTGLVRVFYKHGDSTNLKSALWTGGEWWAEDFLRNPQNLTDVELPDNSDFTRVTGGFGGTGFTP